MPGHSLDGLFFKYSGVVLDIDINVPGGFMDEKGHIKFCGVIFKDPVFKTDAVFFKIFF